MAMQLPYVNSPGNLRKALDKVIEASTPPRFTADFLGTKLGLTGGSARPIIPFFKRIGFLGSDGTPTELYKQFRNSAESGAAAARALKVGYEALYSANEYVHDATDTKLKGLIVQLTGEPDKSKVVTLIVSSFKVIKDFANFDEVETEEVIVGQEPEPHVLNQSVQMNIPPQQKTTDGVGLNLSYTINLNLPATSDIAVFNAIFKSLKENLLSE